MAQRKKPEQNINAETTEEKHYSALSSAVDQANQWAKTIELERTHTNRIIMSGTPINEPPR